MVICMFLHMTTLVGVYVNATWKPSWPERYGLSRLWAPYYSSHGGKEAKRSPRQKGNMNSLSMKKESKANVDHCP